MKAEEIKAGDVLMQDGAMLYTVLDVQVVKPNPMTSTKIVEAKVKFRDGGTAFRQFRLGTDTPLVRG